MFCGQMLRLITFLIFSLVVILVSEERALHIEPTIKTEAPGTVKIRSPIVCHLSALCPVPITDR